MRRQPPPRRSVRQGLRDLADTLDMSRTRRRQVRADTHGEGAQDKRAAVAAQHQADFGEPYPYE